MQRAKRLSCTDHARRTAGKSLAGKTLGSLAGIHRCPRFGLELGIFLYGPRHMAAPLRKQVVRQFLKTRIMVWLVNIRF